MQTSDLINTEFLAIFFFQTEANDLLAHRKIVLMNGKPTAFWSFVAS